MNKLQLVIRFITILIFSFLAFSCKKEPDVNKDIDLSDAYVRVVKVEQLDDWGSPPFLYGRTSFQYLYQNDDVELLYNSIDSSGNFSGKHKLIKISEENYHIDYQFSTFKHFIIANFNEIAKPISTTIKVKKGYIESFFDTINTYLPIYLDENPRQFREIFFNYNPANLLESISGKYSSTSNGYVEGDAFSLLTTSWENNNLLSYRYEKTLNKVYKPGFSPFLNSPVLGIDMEVRVLYRKPENLPKMLIRMVNQSLIDIFPLVTEDYLFNWMTYLSKDGNWLTNYYFLESSPKYFHSSWILSLSNPSFYVIPEQDQIISSKRMVGKKMVDIVDGEPVYQAVDSTATFPYTHDPVAKTLEIAGLKIWYEVVD